ncbi:Uncharacterised protein [Escherichia coli]|nr:Uncharacterised protein [Escherichia coli]SQN30025.1 Uncharacterised protein [Escherichia coli]
MILFRALFMSLAVVLSLSLPMELSRISIILNLLKKRKINENFVELFNSPSVLLPVFYNSVTWSRFGCISVFFFQK